jgi:hypothetical protein
LGFLVNEHHQLEIAQYMLKREDPPMVAQTWLEAATYAQATDAQAAVAELRREGFTEQDIKENQDV